MIEIVRIDLDNEMDLILAHKRAMKLLELCGIGLSAQTTFATAVSEIARCSIGDGLESSLSLGIQVSGRSRKDVVAIIKDKVNLKKLRPNPFRYAERLSGGITDEQKDGFFTYSLSAKIRFATLITDARIKDFRSFFETEPPLSPYDEIRKKNVQLITLSEQLSDSEEQYRHLSESLPQLIFSMNPKKEVTLSNKNFKSYFGSEGLDFGLLSSSVLHGDDLDGFTTVFNHSLAEKKIMRSQVRLKGKKEFVWHLFSLVPFKDEHNNVTKWNGFFVDIHAQKLVEETLRDNQELKQVQQQLVSNQKLLEATVGDLTKKNNELEQFAHIVSHDLQEPLRKMQFFASFYQDSELATKQEYAPKIIQSAGRLRDLIGGILQFSHIGHKDSEFRQVDLDAILNNVVADHELLIAERTANVDISPLPTIHGDASQLYQLFSNLLSNSLKYSTEIPHITLNATQITAGHEDFLKTGRVYHHLMFTDNGIGFKDEYKEFIFKIFKRLHENKEFTGTGLGLAICKKVIENHSGHITVESQPQKGATFHLYFPSVGH
ncbi:PAS domain-containing sensor histidine kinase [Flavobacterium selenitireducens]|uniref:PAS domain-containing sensor histidine kinase n=1 Tax=Flavobacterium selenitireducens TaxID=2722704 RepID=UPI00168B76CF|nr:ATP-binding protein [Flavobacterium selenitireducens]MBD3581877.1 PAS domain S-box protein [Flavobacterium selenitireducens]